MNPKPDPSPKKSGPTHLYYIVSLFALEMRLEDDAGDSGSVTRYGSKNGQKLFPKSPNIPPN
jgi:hypothetical protein